MDKSDLHAAVMPLVIRNIDATDITIKGKGTQTISFTAPRRQYQAIADMCVESGWTFHTSADQFAARELDRYQVHLDGRTK